MASLVVLCASPADAISPEPSASGPVIPGIGARSAQPADPLYFVTLSHELGVAGAGHALRPAAPDVPLVGGGFRYRRLKVIHYATPLRVAQSEMMINLDAPGAGNAIVSLELIF